jgi:hypothetical protein
MVVGGGVTKGIEVVSLRAASSLKERNRPQVPAAEDLINRLDQQGTEVPVLEIMAPRAKRCTLEEKFDAWLPSTLSN